MNDGWAFQAFLYQSDPYIQELKSWGIEEKQVWDKDSGPCMSGAG